MMNDFCSAEVILRLGSSLPGLHIFYNSLPHIPIAWRRAPCGATHERSLPGSKTCRKRHAKQDNFINHKRYFVYNAHPAAVSRLYFLIYSPPRLRMGLHAFAAFAAIKRIASQDPTSTRYDLRFGWSPNPYSFGSFEKRFFNIRHRFVSILS